MEHLAGPVSRFLGVPLDSLSFKISLKNSFQKVAFLSNSFDSILTLGERLLWIRIPRNHPKDYIYFLTIMSASTKPTVEKKVADPDEDLDDLDGEYSI